MPKSLPLSALGIMLFCNVAWAMNVVVSKIAVSSLGLPPLFYTVLRSGVVLAVLFPLLMRGRPARLGLVLLIGFAITGGSFGLQFIGLQTASPSAVGIVNLSGAPLTVLFAIIFLGEEVRWRRGLGMALALGGVGLAIGAPSEAGDPVGLGFAFAGVFIGAFASVFVKRLEVGAVSLQAWAGAGLSGGNAAGFAGAGKRPNRGGYRCSAGHRGLCPVRWRGGFSRGAFGLFPAVPGP